MDAPKEPSPFDVRPLTESLPKSHYKHDVQPSICTTSMASLFVDTCTKYPRKNALIFRRPHARDVVTFGELLKAAEVVASALIDAGIKRGERVGIIGPNCAEWAAAEYGACLAGAVLVRLLTAFNSVDDIQYVISKTGCKGLLFHPGFNCEYQDLIETALSRKNVTLDTIFALTASCSENFKCLNVVQARAIGDDARTKVMMRVKEITEQDPVAIYLTSGSTGFPKFVPLNSINILNQCPGQMARFGLSSDEIMYNDRPFSHVGSFTHFIVYPGLTTVIVDPKVSLEQNQSDFVFKVIEEEKPTVALMFLHLLHKFIEVVDTRKYDMTSLKRMVTGGQMAPRKILGDVHRKVPLVIVYGATELAGAAIISSLMDDTEEVVIGNTGFPMPLTEIKIVDDAGEVCPIGQSGAMYIKTPLLMAGYWNDKEKTDAVVTEDGWYKTRDEATMNDRGYIKVLGRKDDAILRAAQIIFPNVLEEKLLELEQVEKAVVTGVPDRRFGQEICACVIPKGGTGKLTSQEITELKRQAQSVGNDYEHPGYVLIWDDFPLNANQKVGRNEIKKMAIAELKLVEC